MQDHLKDLVERFKLEKDLGKEKQPLQEIGKSLVENQIDDSLRYLKSKSARANERNEGDEKNSCTEVEGKLILSLEEPGRILYAERLAGATDFLKARWSGKVIRGMVYHIDYREPQNSYVQHIDLSGS